MRVMMIWEYYDDFLRQLYRNAPGMSQGPFTRQREIIMGERFGWPASLAQCLQDEQHSVHFIVANASSMQEAWAREHDMPWFLDEVGRRRLVLAQAASMQPDIILMPAIKGFADDHAIEFRRQASALVLWAGYAMPAWVDLSQFAAVLTPNPGIVSRFDPLFAPVHHVVPGFDHSILDLIGEQVKSEEIVFIGNIAPSHRRRLMALAELVRSGVPIRIYGQVQNSCDDPAYQAALEMIKPACRPPIYTSAMYALLSRARIAINIHSDAADRLAANMRLFETTGVGTCLLTENSSNLAEYFLPGEEVVTYDYDEPGDLVRAVLALRADPERIDRIARRGQERTLRDHGLEKTARRFVEIFEPMATR